MREPVSSYHKAQEASKQAFMARRIHQVDYKDIEPAKGALRSIALGMLGWFTLIAVVIGVMAVLK